MKSNTLEDFQGNFEEQCKIAILFLTAFTVNYEFIAHLVQLILVKKSQ